MARPTDQSSNRTAMRDVFGQAAHALVGRPTRSMFTAVGVALGIAAAVATIGVTASASGAISDRFDALQATQVTLRYGQAVSRPQPAVLDEVRTLHGVQQAGLLCQAQQRIQVASTLASDAHLDANLFAAQAESLQALGARLQSGRYFDAGNGARRDRVAMLDSSAARQLGLTDNHGYQVFIGTVAYTIAGVFTAPADQPRLTDAVVLPYQNCLDDAASRFSDYQQPEIDLQVRLGAANQVAREARLAAAPDGPDRLVALVPPDLSTFRRGVEGATRALFLGLAAVSLIIGALGVSNTTLVSVLERRGEIGLRRAIGASRRAVAAQFLVESAMLGLLGGLLGTVVGIDVTSAISIAQRWLVVLDPQLIGLGVLMGVVTGALAGLYPAWTATRFAPAETLRGQ